MTGKQIAANLRKSRRRWGLGKLFASGRYCVLGIKANEAGISNKVLIGFDAHPHDDYPRDLKPLIRLNDQAGGKRDLITTLEGKEWAKVRFPVERFIRFLKARTKKYIASYEEDCEF